MTKLSIQRPIFIFVIMLTITLIGMISFRSMRKENNPEVNFGTVTVTTVYRGAGPDDVNQLITRRIEEAVSGIAGVREVIGASQEGVSAVVIQLELEADIEVALSDIRSKVDSVANLLPRDALKPTISKIDNSSTPILNLAVSSDTLSSRDLRDAVEDKVIDRISQIPGVASATISGGDQREIQIRVKKDRLQQYGIGVLDVLAAVNAANTNTPGGKYVANGNDVSVRVKSDFVNIDQIRAISIKVSDPASQFGKGRQIPITEIADVEDAIAERTTIARLNGRDTVSVAVQKTKNGNTVEVATAVKALIADTFDPAGKIKKKGLATQFGLKFVNSYDESIVVDESLKDVSFSLYFGVVLVALIVYLFLHNFRGTLIVALAIPVCIFAAFTAMKLVGFTVNTLSMLGLSLAIGVLVDDAIVVLENIFRHLRKGEDPREAALNGRNEIGLAALAITAADVIVFTPIAFAGGVAGQFFKPLALTYVFAVAFSLFVSFTLTPLLAARWYRTGENMEEFNSGFAGWFEKRFSALERRYHNALVWALNHRWFVFIAGNAVLLMVIAFLAGSFSPTASEAFKSGFPLLTIFVVLGVVGLICNFVFYKRFTLRPLYGAVLFGLLFPISGVAGHAVAKWKKEPVFNFAFVPSTDPLSVTAVVELPVGSSLATTDEAARIVESKFIAHPEVKFTLALVGKESGSQFGTSNSSSNFAEITGTLYERRSTLDKLFGTTERLRGVPASTIVRDLTKSVGKIPGAAVRVTGVSGFNFGRAIQISLRSDDRVLLAKTAQTIRDRLASGEIPEIINPEVSVKAGKPEVQVRPDYQRASDLGISAATLGSAIRTLYQGNDDNKLRVLGREYPVRVMLDLEERDNPSTLLNVPISFNQGRPIYVGSVASTDTEPGLTSINRRNRAEEIQVTADIQSGKSNGVVSQTLAKWIVDNKLIPEGVQQSAQGESDVQAREGAYLGAALLIGIVGVYAILAMLYNNWLYPMVIQVAQPQAFVGALVALMITNQSFSVIGFIGIVALVGLVSKNAILLVDYTNTLRDRGLGRQDAILQAGPIRLRPIVMTTVALVLGLLPVAMALGRGSEFRQSIGTIVLGGIILSTLLTLLVIPVTYTILDDMGNLFAKWFGKQLMYGGPEGTGPRASDFGNSSFGGQSEDGIGVVGNGATPSASANPDEPHDPKIESDR